MNVCAIIVTYNRKELLLRCIKAVLGQTYKVDSLVIVDNASTDHTWEFLQEQLMFLGDCPEGKLFLVHRSDDIDIFYIRMDSNKGGAGGFSMGLKSSHQMKKFDSFWMMDDDGYPSPACLEKQMAHIHESDYVMPISIDIDQREYLSWPTRLRNGTKTIRYDQLKDSWGEVMDYIFPFNGSLLTRKIVDDVGYINENLFLWGDEYEHYWRCRKKGYKPITVTSAEFYHPSNKMSFVPICWGLLKVPYAESDLRMVCLIRNYTHIYWHYDHKYKILYKFFLYTWLFLITRRCDFYGYKLYLLSVKDGLTGNFTRHLRYLN